MKESVTYQGILEEGELKALHRTILGQGQIRFGVPSNDIEMAIQSITDVARLDRMSFRLLGVASWQELLAVQ